MSDVPDNIVAIETRFTEAAPVDLLPQRWDACRHEHTILDEKLRTVACRDCGEERLDPFGVLVGLARHWRRWQQEAAQLRKLNAEYHDNQRTQWERSRDRHLNAHPDHATSFHAQIAGLGEGVFGHSRRDFACDRCWSLFIRYDRRWIARRAPEPPPGKLIPDAEA